MQQKSRVKRVGLIMHGFKERHLTKDKLSGKFWRVFLAITIQTSHLNHQAISLNRPKARLKMPRDSFSVWLGDLVVKREVRFMTIANQEANFMTFFFTFR